MPLADEVTWSEVTEHLRRELYLDDEWTVEDDDELIWQPGILPVHVTLTRQAEFPDGTPFLVIKAWARVAQMPEQEGKAFAEDANFSFPLGSFYWRDGYVVAACGVNLHSGSRSNLALLHVAVLVMATVIHELVDSLPTGARIPELQGDERALGRRQTPDELLDFFAPEVCELPGQEVVAELWSDARPVVNATMAGQGFTPGHSDATVDFYNTVLGISLGFGFEDEPSRFGVGVRAQAIATPMLEDLPAWDFVNEANAAVHDFAPAHIGHLNWVDPGQGWATGSISAFLPWAYLGRFTSDPEQLAAATFNALAQVMTTASPVAGMFLGE